MNKSEFNIGDLVTVNHKKIPSNLVYEIIAVGKVSLHLTPYDDSGQVIKVPKSIVNKK